MKKMQMHILLGLWNAKKSVIEEENEQQNKQQNQQSGSYSVPSVSSMMSQARSAMPRAPSLSSMKVGR